LNIDDAKNLEKHLRVKTINDCVESYRHDPEFFSQNLVLDIDFIRKLSKEIAYVPYELF
jgi:hypothetical protein